MVKGHRTPKLQAHLSADGHEFVSDVDAKLGGEDTGPTPHRLIEAALTACTIITCQMYADRNQIPLESTDVDVMITSEGAESTFSRKIQFKGNLTMEQRQRLLQIANKCPIHKLLTSQISIKTEGP